MKKTIVLLFSLVSCQTTQQAKEIKLLGFEENVAKGKSIGPIQGDDCVYHIFGYWLGGFPTLQKAVMNARHGKTTTVNDAFGSNGHGSTHSEVRYFNNMAVSNDGFDIGLFGKTCIKITATGYK